MRETVGNRHAQQVLERALRADQFSHAYLLTGPQSIGKTTLALDFARALECTGRTAGQLDACGTCVSCRKIAHGNHPDVTLVEPPEGKRFLPIEQIREVQHAANLAPSEGHWRVFILPEAERMLPAAANALLKTLEGPPPGVVLLLTSAEPEALLATLVSRCQQIAMQPLAPEEVAEALQARWQVDSDEALALAALANGRLGWAVRAHTTPALRAQRAEDLARITALSVARKDERLRQAGTLATDAERARHFVELWLLWWRDVVLAACGVDSLASMGDARAEALQRGRTLGRTRAYAFLRSLLAAQAALDVNANPRLTLEVLMLDLPTS